MTFARGETVIVRDDWPEARGPAHIRTPHYVRGRSGRVVERLGAFANPEDLAFARAAGPCDLYHVSFAVSELWPDAATGDEVLVEIYAHWLRRA